MYVYCFKPIKGGREEPLSPPRAGGHFRTQ